MADLARLVVRLEADSLKFQKELDAAKRKLSSFEGSASKTAKQVGKVLGAAAVAAAAGLAVMVKRSIDLADDMSKAAQKIGVTTESLSQMRYAADLAGVAAASLDKSLLKLNRAMSEATITSTSKAAMAFKALGVEVQNADGSLRSSDAVFDDLADKMSGMRDGATKTALAMDIFGKSGADLIPLLNGGSAAMAEARAEADALGQTIDGKAAKAAEQFNDNLSRLSKVMSGAVLQATQSLIPLMANMSDELVKTAKDTDAMKRSSDSLVTGFRLLISAAILIKGAFQTIGVAIAGGAAAMDQFRSKSSVDAFANPFAIIRDSVVGLFKDDVPAASAAMDTLEQSFSDIKSQMERDGQLIDKVWSDAVSGAEAAAAGTTDSAADIASALTGMGDAAKAAASEQASAMSTIVGMVQALQQQTATFEAGEGAVIRYRIAQGDLAATFAAAGAGAEQYKAQLIALTDQLETQRAATEATAKHQQVFDDVMAQGKATTEAMRTPLEAYQSTIADLNSQLSVGAINQETYNRAVAAAGESFDKAQKGASEWTDSLSGILSHAGENIQDSLADFLFDPFADGTKSMAEKFSEMLRKMAAEIAAATIMKSFFNALTGGVPGQAGGIAGGIASLFGGARANGGPVSGGTPYLVGERGPELIVPGSSGNVMNARETAGLGGTSVTMNVMTPDADSFRKSRRQVVNGVKIGFGV